tara:strand:+ start:1122 stop:1403 length:282 start_codon:yes stop_codon:yes gene_type:complete
MNLTREQALDIFYVLDWVKQENIYDCLPNYDPESPPYTPDQEYQYTFHMCNKAHNLLEQLTDERAQLHKVDTQEAPTNSVQVENKRQLPWWRR